MEPLFDSAYEAAVAQCLAGRPAAGANAQALASARCPPPAPLLSAALALPPAGSPEALSEAALARAAEAAGACATLAALAPDAAAGLACFAALADWLFQAAGAMQEPGWYRENPAAPALWQSLESAGARLAACMELLLRQRSSAQQQQQGAWCLAPPSAAGGSGGAGGTASAAAAAAAHAVMMRAMCRFMAGKLRGAASGSDAAMAAHAAADLQRLAPFGAPGLVQLLAATPPGSVEASVEGARCFACLQQALAKQGEIPGG